MTLSTPAAEPTAARRAGPDEFAHYALVGRVRLLSKRVCRGLQLEFVHNLRVCRQWRDYLDLLATASLGLVYPRLSGRHDEGKLFDFQTLVADAVRAVNTPLAVAGPQADPEAPDPSVVVAVGRAVWLMRQAKQLLVEWQGGRDLGGDSAGRTAAMHGRWAERAAADVDLEELRAEDAADVRRRLPADAVRAMLTRAAREFQSRERAAAGPVSVWPARDWSPVRPDDSAAAALAPFVDLCMSARAALLMEHVVLALYPSRWAQATHDEVYRLQRRTVEVTPPGRLRVAAAYKESLVRGYFPPNNPGLAEYLTAAVRPDHRPRLELGYGWPSGVLARAR